MPARAAGGRNTGRPGTTGRARGDGGRRSGDGAGAGEGEGRGGDVEGGEELEDDEGAEGQPHEAQQAVLLKHHQPPLHAVRAPVAPLRHLPIVQNKTNMPIIINIISRPSAPPIASSATCPCHALHVDMSYIYIMQTL